MKKKVWVFIFTVILLTGSFLLVMHYIKPKKAHQIEHSPKATTKEILDQSEPVWVGIIFQITVKKGKRHHREKWDYLTWLPLWGTGGINSYRILPFLYSRDNLDDPNVEILKSNNK